MLNDVKYLHVYTFMVSNTNDEKWLSRVFEGFNKTCTCDDDGGVNDHDQTKF